MDGYFKTVGQLIRYLTEDMKATHLSPNDTAANNFYLISQSTHLFRLSSKEAEKLMEGRYKGCRNVKEVKEELLYDYCVVKLNEFSLSRSINSYKDYLLEE